jgi:protein TonB
MKYILFIFVFGISSVAFAQKPSAADSANQNIKKAPPPQESVSNDEPSQSDFIEIDEEPRPLKDIQKFIKYPEEARRSGLEGKVMCSVLIGKDGNVKRVTIDRADDDIFRHPVIEAFQKVRFSPARKDGKPVMVWYSQTISFKLAQFENDQDEDEQDHH